VSAKNTAFAYIFEKVLHAGVLVSKWHVTICPLHSCVSVGYGKLLLGVPKRNKGVQ
jgi:hypothetical protein